MKIAILSRNSALYSTRRLVEALRQRGHEALVVDTMTVAVELGVNGSAGSDKVKLLTTSPRSPATGQSWLPHQRSIAYLSDLDGIIPRIGSSITYFGLAAVRMFERQGIRTTAASQGIAQSRDKLLSLQLMEEAGLPIPRTALAPTPDAIYSAMELVGPPPVVVKLVQSTQGRGVFLVPNASTVTAVLDRLRAYNKPALIQEYIPEAAGKDMRIIVVGGRCVAAMVRSAPADDFRSNLHLGGTATAVQLDAATKKIAIAAAKAHGLSVAGVDIIQSKRGALLLEVNSSPGLEGIEKTTGVDVAGEIIRFLER